MSVEIWPSLPPEQLITAVEQTQVSPMDHFPSHLHPTFFTTPELPPLLLINSPMSCPIEDGWVLLPQLSPPTRLQLTPPAAPEQQRRELEWLLNELHDTLQNLKHGLEDCYALLAPVDPGSTLVVSTHRNEIVKGHITRVGTRIVKGTLTLKLRTHPHQTYTIDPDHPIQLAPLANLHALLTESIDLLTLTLGYTYTPTSSSSTPGTTSPTGPPSSPTSSTATFIAAQLRLLSQSLTEAASLLKGPQPLTASDATWVSKSCSPHHFRPQPGSSLSLHWGIQESQLVLWLRALEPADAPVNLGLKFALAIGTARRLEHDEAEQIFMYTYPEGAVPPETVSSKAAGATSGGNNGGGDGGQQKGGSSTSGNISKGNNASSAVDTSSKNENEAQVFVREKVRVESADPALMSLGTKLAALATTLALARGNLAVVMGEVPEW
ncbi:hypothetical protein VP1G_01563 [Cytospora mali]|uniref:Uncharacterized protein n=1 Tax=Cytospora mali TaxID=578113 RepID=A0A194URH8_CYTMA|nr:hypothetical protein VP1G_01563 [Valsa mali var. pyri (nom. inval.)]